MSDDGIDHCLQVVVGTLHQFLMVVMWKCCHVASYDDGSDSGSDSGGDGGVEYRVVVAPYRHPD